MSLAEVAIGTEGTKCGIYHLVQRSSRTSMIKVVRLRTGIDGPGSSWSCHQQSKNYIKAKYVSWMMALWAIVIGANGWDWILY
jgi:hypothetical protein